VQEERQAAPLVLLGRDQLIREPLPFGLPLTRILEQPPLAERQVRRDRRRDDREEGEDDDRGRQGKS
jgi:hypothetical protein